MSLTISLEFSSHSSEDCQKIQHCETLVFGGGDRNGSSLFQLQVGLQANVPQPSEDDGEDDVDAALTDLQIALEGGSASAVALNGRRHHNGGGLDGIDAITVVPTLTGHLRFLRPKKFTLKGYR